MTDKIISRIDFPIDIDILELSDIKKYILNLLSIIEKQSEQIAVLIEENALLKEEVNRLKSSQKLNSQNSSKPPSTDRKSNNSREKKGRKAGGQTGHKGSNLETSEEVDKTTKIEVTECKNCKENLSSITGTILNSRQVFDIPEKLIHVEEFQIEVKICSKCGCKNESSFPKGVENKVQYGAKVKSVVSYLSQYQLIPYERGTELFRDIFGKDISEGTIYNSNVELFNKLEKPEEAIKELIINSPVVNYDETSLRVNNLNYWLHVSCTKDLTFYALDRNRSKEATDKIGILPKFTGKAIHDNYALYFQYNCTHGLCNAHHHRELKGAFQEDGFLWSSQMSDLLFRIKSEVDKSTDTNTLSTNQLSVFENEYSKILEEGLKNYPITEDSVKKKGRKKQSKSKNLLDRFLKRREEILLFMYDFTVPFDNNQAERDIRMPKLKQKISGCFRSEDGAKIFGRIRGYISTVKKQGINVLESISNAFYEKPFMAN